MPLPWKKMRVNRISQFVADLQSPKRGGSLVVQTGFPTSLVDLFVKNRDHLKKPSKKNKNRKKNNPSADQVSDRITANCELGSGNFGILVQPSSPKVKNLSWEAGDRGVEAGEFRVLGETHVENRIVDDEQCVGGNWRAVLLAVLKIFAVVVLALSTKKLAVGVTLSAFLLLFLEYAGKHLACFFKPCSKAKPVLQNMAQRASSFLLFLNGFHESEDLKGVIVCEKTGDFVFELVDATSDSDSAIGEIQIVESNKKGSVCVDETGGDKPLIDLLGADYEKERVVDKRDVGDKTLVELLGMDYEKRTVVDAEKAVGEITLVELLGKDYKKIKVVESGEDGGEFIADKKSKGGKNSNIKSKLIKKFVPKKLRRKCKQNEPELEPLLSSEVSCHMGDDKLEGCEEHFNHKDEKQEEQESENMSVFSAEEKSEIQGFNGVSDLGEGSLAGGETPLIVERKGREGNLGYLVLFLIVLAGLFGGRIVALMLTITSCFMPKLAGSLRRSVKICRCSVPISS
ncbi:PREDICTED: ethylene-responsive nuclear [Prunus dulcis]|uniref:PREDICTED: ethylene-responsive nuclear n=2 Tax=Prunus dulcis TaxID=3755 RepID=A0A5E4FMH5_PRUDU|nr:uncharacterized protein LOC117626169 [Prunus dulcis]VVA28351.1 PREDICTED: ethylene-responsive nuclear [Prunus dulcis]